MKEREVIIMNTKLILAKVAEHVDITEAYKHYLERPVLPGFKI